MRKLSTALEAGIPLEKAIKLSGGSLDGVVTDLLDLARVTGVKRSVLLRIAADSLWNGNRLTREANIASSAARASAIVLSALPILASAGAAIFGINVLAFLLGHFFGYLCLFVGLLSIWFGWVWMAKIRGLIVAPRETEGLLLNCAAEVVSSSAIYSETEKMLKKLSEKGAWSLSFRQFWNSGTIPETPEPLSPESFAKKPTNVDWRPNLECGKVSKLCLQNCWHLWVYACFRHSFHWQ